MANGDGGKDTQKYFCHSCGGVTVYLTPRQALDERAHGHDLEAFPLSGTPEDQAFRTSQAERPVVRG